MNIKGRRTIKKLNSEQKRFDALNDHMLKKQNQVAYAKIRDAKLESSFDRTKRYETGKRILVAVKAKARRKEQEMLTHTSLGDIVK